MLTGWTPYIKNQAWAGITEKQVDFVIKALLQRGTSGRF